MGLAGQSWFQLDIIVCVKLVFTVEGFKYFFFERFYWFYHGIFGFGQAFLGSKYTAYFFLVGVSG